MGIPIDEEDCPVCEEFKDGWIFTYGDLVTLLLCFFILLFSMCKYEIEKFKSVAESFKPLPAGTPCLLYTSPSPRDAIPSRMPSSA